MDLASNSEQDAEEWNSSNESFFFKEIPAIKKEYPACFCNAGALCEKHQGEDPTILNTIKLLQRQFTEVTKDETEQESHLKYMEEEIQEIFVSRQDVSCNSIIF
jgi:hypothetical protein